MPIHTTPVEYARHLRRALGANLMTPDAPIHGGAACLH